MDEQAVVGNGFEKGSVVWFSEQKGYGFIRPAGGDAEGLDDIFVHFSGIVRGSAKRRNLLAGQYVEFERADGPKGPYATNVRVVTP